MAALWRPRPSGTRQYNKYLIFYMPEQNDTWIWPVIHIDLLTIWICLQIKLNCTPQLREKNKLGLFHFRSRGDMMEIFDLPPSHISISAHSFTYLYFYPHHIFSLQPPGQIWLRKLIRSTNWILGCLNGKYESCLFIRWYLNTYS